MDNKMDFERQNSIGREGEQLVAAALQREGKTITDVAGNPYYQQQDIDFLVTFSSGAQVTLEVKTDLVSEKTGKVFIETMCRNNASRNGKGWYYYCLADFLCFVQPDNGIAHIVKRETLWEMCESGLYKQYESPFSRGYCIPIAALKALPEGKYKQINV